MTVCFGIEPTTERDHTHTETDMTDPNNEVKPPDVGNEPLSGAASGAVLALIRMAELQQPASAYQSALRAIAAERLYTEYTAPALDAAAPVRSVDTSLVITSAALCRLDLQRGSSPNDAGSILNQTLVEGIDGFHDVAVALSYRNERWDGTGPHGMRGVDIPLATRIFVVVDVLIGRPEIGELPDWDATREIVHDQAGVVLDPSLCQAVDRLDLSEIPAPTSPSQAVADLLNQPANRAARTTATEVASSMANAVALAGRTPDLLNLFAQTALSGVGAAEVLIFRTSATQLDSAPTAKVTDGHNPCLDPARLDDLFEFAMQAELRTGATILRDTCQEHKDIALLDGSDGDVPSVPEFIDEIISPILVHGLSWGSIVATRRRTSASFSALDVAQLEQISTEIATAMNCTTHWAEMERMALKDQLTGLGNRHDLYRVLDEIFERPAGDRLDSAMIMCDVDGLKVVNDTLGHHAGDRLLIDAAEALKGAVRNRPGTTVCRIGGDEFCVVIDGGALLTVHEISNSIERLFARSAGSGPERSISCGIALADETVNSRSALLRAADENQYETKRERKRSKDSGTLTQLATQPAITDPGVRRANRD